MTNPSRHTRVRAALCALSVMLLWSARAVASSPAQPDGATLVEVTLRASRTISVPGVTQVVSLDDSICRAETTPGGVRLSGVTRGESIVFVWVGDQRTSLLVRVVPPFMAVVEPSLSQEQLARLGQGGAATTAQVTFDPTGGRTYYFQHQFNWSQQVDGRRLSLRGQAQDATSPGVPLNIDALSAEYSTPSMTLTVLDFGLNLNGGPDARVTNASTQSAFVFRGAHLALTRGRNQVEAFGGTTLPSYYRSLRDTSGIAGVTVSRKQSAHLYLYGTTAGVSVPQSMPGRPAAGERQDSLFTTTGFSYRPSDRWSTQLTGGWSNRGLYGDGALAMTGERVAAWVTSTASSPAFPLNQLQLLSGGGTSTRAGGTWKASRRAVAALFVQHSDTRATPLFASFAGRSDYLNPNLNLILSDSQSLTLNAVHSRSRGGRALDAQTSMTSLDLGWTSQWMQRFVNSAQVSGSDIQDPLTAGVRLSFRDTLTLRLKGGHISFGYQHNQQDPSLVTRLRQQIGLLPGDLQQVFLSDPTGFVQSPRLPADVRDLLDLVRTADTQASVSGQFRLGSRVNVSATYSRLENAPRRDQRATTNALGYVLAWQMTPSLQIRSSLADTYMLDIRRRDLARTTTFLLGLSTTFHGAPAWLPPSGHRAKIEGRVFVDRNATGKHDGGEAGLAGITVQLDGGRQTVTDAAGRYQFTGLKPGAYQVSMALGQFREPVRVTTLTNVTVDLIARTQASVEFGIVNFSRLIGSVYNDYDGLRERRGDSPGLPNVTAIVTAPDGVERRVVTDGSGEFRIDDLSPGSYRLRVDPGSIPPNYIYPSGSVAFDVKPTRTVVVDYPVRALRSVAGHIYLRASATGQGEPELEPASGVTVVAGSSQSTTDSNGRFVLRDLPAGDVVVNLRAAKPLPPGMPSPTGALRLPKEPVQVQDAVIVIRNPDLLRYYFDR